MRNRKKQRGILYAGMMLLAIFSGLFLYTDDAWAAAKALNVETHTKEEIIQYVKEHTQASEDKLTYSQAPVAAAPYSAGALSDETQEYALAALNEVRYIAGIYHQVTTDSTYVSQAQTGALINYVNNQMSHTPIQPEGMSDEMYQLGYLGTSRGNIVRSSGVLPLGRAVIHCWMADEDDSNISRVGHRRWCLNPAMGKTGFGAVSGSNGTFGVMYAFDRSYSVKTQPIVAWPAQNMPIEYFAADYPWSLSSETSFSDDVSVKVIRLSDNQEWNFSSTSADGYFNYNKAGYGQYYCLVFRPAGIMRYDSGDEYRVEVTENSEVTLDYTVSFFALEEIPEDMTITLSSTSGKVSISENGYYNGVARITLSDSSISEDKISVISSDEGIAKAMVGSSGGSIWLYVKGIKDGVATITVSLSRDITATFTVTVGTGGGHVHTFASDYTIDSAPTCETAGSKSRHCTGCGEKTDVTVIPASGHTIVKDSAKAATCTESGLTEGSHCSVCGIILILQEKVPALGHHYGEWKVIKAATYTEKGEKQRICTVCGEKETESIEESIEELSQPPILTAETVVSEAKTGGAYKITGLGVVEYLRPLNAKVSTVTIPQTIEWNGLVYQVTAIAGNAFKNNKSIKKVIINSNVVSIGANAFSGCSKLKSVTMGNNITSIGAKAFYKCTSLTNITIPSEVNKIGKQAFYGCKKLKSITIKTKKLSLKNIGSKAFKGIHAKANIKVPKVKMKGYKKALKARGVGKKVKIKKF